MNKTQLSEIPYSLFEEAAALETLGRILGMIDDIDLDSKYKADFQIQDISALGYLISQSATRIYDLQEHIELAFRKIPELTVDAVEPNPSSMTLADATTFFENTQPMPPGFFSENLPIDGEELSQRIVTEQILDNPAMAAHLFDEL